ncbi:TVP38/TMEM64 family protein [Cohnella thermotolerans]|uniref:TVP38/TMEM64 family protein n=1 Tax=Cohnella thermotolerans TaxID=329858 RepID=UPI0004152B8C|nr:TVP38/TMEM64 family protein [Cohnella thermotolerans]
MIKKRIILLGYVAAIIVIVMNKDPILRWLDDESANNLLLLFGAAVLLALIPIVPYGVVAGIMGAKYGPFWGGFLNVISSTLAAALLFLSVRTVFQEQGRRLLSKYKRMDRFTELMERNAFLAVLTVRLIPFVPAAAVNIYTAISRMRFGHFFTATLLGKIPVMFVFAVIGDQLLSDLRDVLWTSLIYVLFLSVVFLIYWFFRRRSDNKSKSAIQG